jgi:hypothetical protein
MAEFPSQRLFQADATLDEVAQLREEFRNSDVGVQSGLEDFFKPLSLGAIRDWLATRRAEGYFSAPEAPQSPPQAPVGESTFETYDAPETDNDDEDAPDSLGSDDSKGAPDSLEG